MRLNEVIIKNNIYTNNELSTKLCELENKYLFINYIKEYKNYVNFSKNIDEPYHSWFKYREGYSKKLISDLIHEINLKENEFIIDPFCGSGTTLLETAFKGFNALGIDINPMSAFIAKTKTLSLSNNEIIELQKYSKIIEKLEIKNYIKGNEDISKYFNNENFNEIMTINNFIENIIPKNKIFSILKLTLLTIIEDVSNRKRDGNGLKTRNSKISKVIQYYINKLNIIINDIKTTTIQDNLVLECFSDSAFNLSKITKKFSEKYSLSPGAIIFSPPYANSFDYFESYKMELRIGGFVDKIEDIKELRKSAIRSFISADKSEDSIPIINMLCDEIEIEIPKKEMLTGKNDNLTKKVPSMIKGYFNDMSRAIKECYDVLPKSKKVFIVVDQSAYLGKIIPTDTLLAYIAEQYGFSVEKLLVCRYAKTSSQQIKRFPYLTNTLRETLIVLKK